MGVEFVYLELPLQKWCDLLDSSTSLSYPKSKPFRFYKVDEALIKLAL